MFILQKGPEMDGELSKVTQGVEEEPGLETTGLLSFWDVYTHTPFPQRWDEGGIGRSAPIQGWTHGCN